MELSELISEWQNEKKTYSNEGSRGVENLCKLVRAIGYRDSMNRMQFRDGCLGDLVEFFEDNSGAIEAVIDWIGDRDVQEWKDNLESELPERESTCDTCGESLKSFMKENGINLEEILGCPDCDS